MCGRRDHARIVRHEERREGGRECEHDDPNAGENAEGELGAQSADFGRTLDIAGADILSRQDRDRH